MPLAVLLDSAAAISPADMRVGAPGMATGAGAVDPPESAIGAPVASVGSGCGAIGAPRAPVSTGGWEVAVGATRVSGEAQAATSASAGNSIRNLDGIGIRHLGRWEWYDRPTHLSGVRFPRRASKRAAIPSAVAGEVRLRAGRPLSDAEIDLADVVVMGEGLARPLARHAAVLQQVDAARHAQCRERVLLDQQDGG